MEIISEWTPEGKLNLVGKPEKILRYQNQHMIVCMRGCFRIKPGGTAGDYVPVPAL